MATLIRRCAPGLLGLALLTTACDDGLGPDRASVHVVVQPRFAQHEPGTVDGTDPALLVDNVRVVILDEAGDTVVDQVTEWPLDQETIRIEVAVEVTGDQLFDLILQARGGDTVLFQARRQLSLSSDLTSPEPLEAVLEYAGPEASLETIQVLTPFEAFFAGNERDLVAVGTTSDGAEVTDPLMVWTSLDTAAAIIDSTGTVRVKHDVARTVRVVGRVAFSALADTVELPVSPSELVITVDPDTIRALGSTQRARSVGLGVNGDPVRNLNVDWTVRNTTIARVEPGSVTGDRLTLGALRQGTTRLVATAGIAVDSIRVVVDQVVTGAAPVPTRAVLRIGDSVHLSIVPVDAGGTTVPDAALPVWSSSDPAIASVDATGLVTANSAPSQTIDGVAVAGEINGTRYDARIEVVNGETVGTPTAISLGDEHGCRIQTGRIFCRGDGEYGQLGNGLFTDQVYAVEALSPLVSLGESFTRVSTGGHHTCAIADSLGLAREAVCWGDNRYGQLGDGTLTDRAEPTAVAISNVEGDLVQVASGGSHTCGLTAVGTAYCWGSSFHGELGNGTTGVIATTPTPVSGGHTFTQLAAGWLHVCGLAQDQTVWCWGRGAEGQLGNGSTDDSSMPVQVSGGQTFALLDAGAAHTCGVTTAGGVQCWGYNSSGQVGVGSTAFVVSIPTTVTFPLAITARDVALGKKHGCALASDGIVFCWGANDQLQLGQPDPRASRSPVLVPVDFLPFDIAGGGSEICAIDETRSICWGGVPAGYLGRNVLLSPASEPTGGGFSIR